MGGDPLRELRMAQQEQNAKEHGKPIRAFTFL